MSYKIKNTALDPSKALLHRRAPKLQMEPLVAGKRLRIRSQMTLTKEQFAHNRDNLELYKAWGVVDWEEVEADGLKPPTMKEILDAGYDEEAAKQIFEREQEMFKAGEGPYQKRQRPSNPTPQEPPKAEETKTDETVDQGKKEVPPAPVDTTPAQTTTTEPVSSESKPAEQPVVPPAPPAPTSEPPKAPELPKSSSSKPQQPKSKR